MDLKQEFELKNKPKIHKKRINIRNVLAIIMAIVGVTIVLGSIALSAVYLAYGEIVPAIEGVPIFNETLALILVSASFYDVRYYVIAGGSIMTICALLLYKRRTK